MNRTTTLAGMLAGLSTAGWTLFEFAMGWHDANAAVGAYTGFIALVFPIAAIAWAQRRTKRERGGHLTFGEAMQCALAVSSIMAAFGVLFYLVYYRWINPGFLARLQQSAADTTLASQLITVGLGSLLAGSLIGAIGGVLLRSRAPRAKEG